MIFPTLSSPVAFALPATISPTLAGIVVGAVVSVLGFVAVAILASRSPSRSGARARRRVITIPPYATGAERIGPSTPVPFAGGRPIAFVDRATRAPSTPSMQLSASALARMGCPVGPFGERLPATLSEEDVEDDVEEDVDAIDVELDGGSSAPFPVACTSSVAPGVVLSAPHPLSLIPSSSPAMRGTPISGVQAIPTCGGVMRAARIDELSFDDDRTEVCETLFPFEEEREPRTRSTPPKIRPVEPAPPRFQSRS